MKVLVISGDRWHPTDIVRAGLNKLKGFEFIYADTADNFEDYNAVMLLKDNCVSAENQTEFMQNGFADKLIKYVENGGSLFAVHAGTCAARNIEGLYKLIGCKFNHHPAACTVTYKFNDRPDMEFVGLDEHYHIDLYEQPRDVFMYSVSQHGTQIGGYRKQYGRGKVAVATPGHTLGIWQDPQMTLMLTEQLNWLCNK